MKNMKNKWSFWASVIAALVAIAVSLGCLIYVSQALAELMSSSNTDLNETAQSICVRCDLLSKNYVNSETKSLFGKLPKRHDGDSEMCCFESSEQVTALIEHVLGKRDTGKEYESLNFFPPSDFTFSPASAHKCLLPSVYYLSRPDMVPQFVTIPLLLNQNHNDERIEHARNVEVMSTGLTILFSGMYYVYSSIRFNPDSMKPCKEFASQSWSHKVVLSRPNDRASPSVLVTSWYTCCDDCVRVKEINYIGGVFRLETGDHLHVEVSGYGLIRFSCESSFLGLYMEEVKQADLT